ncbi:MAG TPA: hypothetical protein VMU86_09875, partial [Steroidobacteraceae bacterium]|nr:hypothetical protein [Steroidobacteraceae bacterium]
MKSSKHSRAAPRAPLALHRIVQRILLIGVRLEEPAAPPEPPPPERLRPLIEAVAADHRRFDARAIEFGDRYRSGFWSIYLLSAFAVLCAVMPLALGWDSRLHVVRPMARLWTFAEVGVIATVSAIYWIGHKRDWQGQWLAARTTAELTWYLPLVAPLVDFQRHPRRLDWYVQVFDLAERDGGEVASLCARLFEPARAALAGAWDDPAFITAYARWTSGILDGQRHYHRAVARRQHALLHRVHRINAGLFGLTAVGALMHLAVHTVWLSLITTFFPALGASLHGALAQSEAYRLSTTS